MKQLVRNVKIIGTGSYLPETIYTNEYLESIIPTSAKWIFENVGMYQTPITWTKKSKWLSYSRIINWG